MAALFQCGDRLRYGGFEPGASGCLVRFTDSPDQLLMLVAGHVVLTPSAKRGDAILIDDGSNRTLGRLWTWTTIDGDPTADVALVWVDPTLVSPGLRGLGVPSTTVNARPAENDVVRIVPPDGQQGARVAKIRTVDTDVNVIVSGPGWDHSPLITYRSQIVCDQMVSMGGDSGTVALDDQGRVVGMVVAGSSAIGTVITPIEAILSNAAWGDQRLEIVDAVNAEAVAPPVPSALPPDMSAADVAMALQFDWLKPAQKAVALQIVRAFEDAGLGVIQQAAALANAVAESNLNPTARAVTSKEDSVGLFQLNRHGGAGQGFSVEELQKIDVQCEIVIRAVTEIKRFTDATSLDTAVAVFVTDFEKPADTQGAIAKRRVIARRFLDA
jgi:hypothetical protein